MTRQRKTHLALLALVPVVVFAAVRCADSTATAPPSPQVAAGQLDPIVMARLAKLHEQHDWVGQFHNEALSFVLAKVKRIPARTRNARVTCETARKAYAEFHKSRRGGDVPPAVDADFERFCSAGSRAAGAISRQWVLRSLGGDAETAVRARARRQAEALDRLDLPALAVVWARRGAIDV